MTHMQLDRKIRKKRRVRSKIVGSGERPRISVNRSNKYIYAQAIDDEKRVTIVSCSSLALQKQKKENKQKVEEAKLVGKELGTLLLGKNIKEAVFDRSYYIYKGRVKALAEGLREAGMKI